MHIEYSRERMKDKSLSSYLLGHLGKAIILNDSYNCDSSLKYSGELLDVFDDGFVVVKTIDEEIICNLNKFQTIKLR